MKNFRIKKKTIVRYVFFILFSQLIFTSCIFDFGNCMRGEGAIVSEFREVSGFTKIDLANSADVFVIQSDNYSLEVKAQANLLQSIRTRVDNGILIIDNEDCIRSDDGIQIFVYLPEIDGLKISGSGDMVVNQYVTSPFIDIILSGSGDIFLRDVEAEKIEATISGSGDIEIDCVNELYSAQQLIFEIPGSGEINSFDLTAENANVNISGSGNCFVKVVNSLNIDISGSGDVFYKGYPQINANVFGSGHVVDAN